MRNHVYFVSLVRERTKAFQGAAAGAMGEVFISSFGDCRMKELAGFLWRDDQGQDIAEYAVMLAVILVIVVGTIRLIGTNANTVFSNVASSIQ